MPLGDWKYFLYSCLPHFVFSWKVIQTQFTMTSARSTQPIFQTLSMNKCMCTFTLAWRYESIRKLIVAISWWKLPNYRYTFQSAILTKKHLNSQRKCNLINFPSFYAFPLLSISLFSISFRKANYAIAKCLLLPLAKARIVHA